MCLAVFVDWKESVFICVHPWLKKFCVLFFAVFEDEDENDDEEE
jgi:hypothetical protein